MCKKESEACPDLSFECVVFDLETQKSLKKAMLTIMKLILGLLCAIHWKKSFER